MKDQEACLIKNELGTHCAHTLTTEVKDYTEAEWHKISYGWVAISYETLLYFKTSIEKLCSISNRCTDPQKKALAEIDERLQPFYQDLDMARSRN